MIIAAASTELGEKVPRRFPTTINSFGSFETNSPSGIQIHEFKGTDKLTSEPIDSASEPTFKLGEVIDERSRRLSDEQKRQLAEILSPHQSSGSGSRVVRIRYRVHDREAAQFARDFQEGFSSVGWNAALQPLDIEMQTPDGLSIAVKWNEFAAPRTAQLLADALKQIGFKVRLINTNMGLREDDIALIIGANVFNHAR